MFRWISNVERNKSAAREFPSDVTATCGSLLYRRVAMIAVMGYIMPEIFRFPGCEVPLSGWVVLLVAIVLLSLLISYIMLYIYIYT